GAVDAADCGSGRGAGDAEPVLADLIEVVAQAHNNDSPIVHGHIGVTPGHADGHGGAQRQAGQGAHPAEPQRSGGQAGEIPRPPDRRDNRGDHRHADEDAELNATAVVGCCQGDAAKDANKGTGRTVAGAADAGANEERSGDGPNSSPGDAVAKSPIGEIRQGPGAADCRDQGGCNKGAQHCAGLGCGPPIITMETKSLSVGRCSALRLCPALLAAAAAGQPGISLLLVAPVVGPLQEGLPVQVAGLASVSSRDFSSVDNFGRLVSRSRRLVTPLGAAAAGRFVEQPDDGEAIGTATDSPANSNILQRTRKRAWQAERRPRSWPKEHRLGVSPVHLLHQPPAHQVQPLSSSPSGDAAHAPPRAVSAGHLCCLGLAENWRSYFSQLRSWEAFCVSAGRPLDLQLTVTCSAATSRTTPGKHRLRSFSSLRSYVHAVSFLHQATGAPLPAKDFVQLALRGAKRRLPIGSRACLSGRCRMSSFCHLFEESPLCTRWSHLHLSPARVESLAGDAALWLRRGGELSARQFISCLSECGALRIPQHRYRAEMEALWRILTAIAAVLMQNFGLDETEPEILRDIRPIESELSEQLHSALEQSGFTESRAALQSAAADALQQIIRSGPNNDDLIFVVGSYSEGWGNSLTTLDGRTDANSDIDVMQLIPGREYHQRGLCECDGAPEQQELVNGHIQCLGFALDNVSACRLCRYPPIAPLLPNRVSNIPHPVLEALRKVLTSASLPCHVVHAASPDRQGEELRVSTSFLENRMLRSLSTLQGQLFVTLKYLVKKVICHKNGFNQQGLKSYHVKTITFRMVDETPVEQWKKENLVSLTRQSLQMLLDCVEKSREQDRQTPDTPDRSRGRIMNHFFLSDVAIYLKGADKERADQHLDGIMSTLRTVIDRLPQLLQQFIGSLRPVSDSGTFYFHPFQIRPNMSPLPLTKSSALEYYQIYDVESLTELIARLPDCALSAREALRALACLKFGDRGTAERVVSSCSSHSVSRGIAWSREKSATEATEEFVMRHLRSRDSAWKFCFRLDQRPKLEFLAGALRACFPLRLSGSNYFYMNFDALLWALRLELRTDREARAQDWIRDVAEREDSDEQELQ
uniref:Mab-21 domain-containing protein n=1 Tax=Macrostomum lignano TaxID=282301 RepID=A0A1I8IKY0_9PLAT